MTLHALVVHVERPFDHRVEADEFSLDAMVERPLDVYDQCMQRHAEATS